MTRTLVIDDDQSLLAALRARLGRAQALPPEEVRRLSELRGDLARSLLPHELLTPLAVVKGLASLLEVEGAIEAGQVKDVAAGILQGARELEATITKFLLCAEVQTSHTGTAMEPARAAAILAEAARAQAVRTDREADLEVEVEPFRSPMSSDHLQAIVHELVENAFAFSERGSAVTVRARPEVGFLVLSVVDRGRGMTADEMGGRERVPFLRRNRERAGIGLGLTIVRKLAEMYGALVSFDTAPGRGTAVRVRFPEPTGDGSGGPPRTNLWLDAADTIIAVDEAWLDFARANGAPELTREAVVGRPLRPFIAGAETGELATLLVATARRGGAALVVPFRCDSVDERRFMTMTLAAEAGGGVHVCCRLDRAETRAAVPLLDRHA
ncbi:MAG TPA: sensor histidine kinase, partial [Vicinamibacteria bacterium]